MGIYRGPGGTGDAVNDASSEALITIQARDAALAAQAAAEVAQLAAELAETNAETAETNAELAETNAEAAQTAAEAAQAAAEAVLVDANFVAVAAIEADITTVAGIAADVTTVAGISADVTAVAAIDSDVTTVAGDIADVSTVAADIADVSTVAGISSDVTTVAGIDSDVTTVAGISSDVTAVAADATDIGLVAGSIANVNTVATNISNVNTTATNISNVNTVAGISGNVTTVAGISANVTTVAGISSDVTTVAGDSADIQLLADNIATIAAKANAGANSDITSLSGLTTPLSVGQGGTGANTLTGYVKGTGTAALTAASTIPNTDITGLGTMSTQAASNVAITGGSINGTTVGASTPSTGAFTSLTSSSTTTLNGTTIPASKTLLVSTDIGSTVQAYDAQLADIAGLTPTDNNFIVGNGTNFVTESGSTARTSLGLGSIATQDSSNVTVTGGTINGTAIGGSTAAAGTFTSLSDSGNLTFTGTGNRITGDFSNATIANRVAFQSSTTNGVTAINALPNGTQTQSNYYAFNGTDPDNSAYMRVAIGAAGNSLAILQSSANGTGTTLPMAFYTGGSERMRIDTSGNVGIGTSSPAFKLQVNGSTSTYIAVTSTGAGTGSGLYTANSTNAYYIGAGAASGGSGLEFRDSTNSATRMVIDSSGNCGIGTSSPSTYGKFAVVTDSANQSVSLATTTSGNSVLNVVGYNSATWAGNAVSSGARIALQNLDSTANNYTQINNLDQSGNTNSSITFVNVSDANNEGYMAFGTRASGGSLAERMRITSGGDVLVGITSARSNAGDVQVSKGISFPATQSAQSDANTLDDYEEGTWTGTIKGTTTDPTTPVTATGTYTKIGRLVFARIAYSNITTTGASGDFYVTGLPFTTADNSATGNVMTHDLATFAGSNLSPYVSGTSVFLYYMSSNGAWNPATHNAGANRYLDLSVTYQV